MGSYQDLSESSIQTHRSPPQVHEEYASDLLSPWVPTVGARFRPFVVPSPAGTRYHSGMLRQMITQAT